MPSLQKRIFYTTLILLLLAGCASSPTFVNGNKSFTNAEKQSHFNAVYFKTEKQFISSPLNALLFCLSIIKRARLQTAQLSGLH